MATEEWLKSHGDVFFLFADGKEPSQVQIPCSKIWAVMTPPTPDASYEQAWKHSTQNDPRFEHKISGILRTFTADIYPFVDWSRGGPKKMKTHKVKKEEQEVPNKSDTKDTLFNMVKQEAKEGAIDAVVDEASNVMMDTVRSVFKDNEAVMALLDSPMGSEASKGVTALLFYYISTEFPDMVPKSGHVANISRRVMRNTTRNVVAPNLALLMENAKALAEISEKVPETAFEERPAGALETEDTPANFDQFSEEEEEAAERAKAFMKS